MVSMVWRGSARVWGEGFGGFCGGGWRGNDGSEMGNSRNEREGGLGG